MRRKRKQQRWWCTNWQAVGPLSWFPARKKKVACDNLPKHASSPEVKDTAGIAMTQWTTVFNLQCQFFIYLFIKLPRYPWHHIITIEKPSWNDAKPLEACLENFNFKDNWVVPLCFKKVKDKTMPPGHVQVFLFLLLKGIHVILPWDKYDKNPSHPFTNIKWLNKSYENTILHPDDSLFFFNDKIINPLL